MKRKALNVDIQPEGLQTTFDVQVENDTNWKCGDRPVPFSPYDPKYPSIYVELMEDLNNSSHTTTIKAS